MSAEAKARKSGEFLSDAALVATGEFRIPHRKLRPEFRLVEPIVFELGGKGSGALLFVPRDYVTDLYSVPFRLLQFYQPEHARYRLPAILHDWLYDSGLVPRTYADRVLLHAMRAVGVSPVRAWAVYLAVRLNGVFSAITFRKGGFNDPLEINAAVVAASRECGIAEAALTYLKQERGD